MNKHDKLNLIKRLKKEGFYNGDNVCFRVENQISGCYTGPTVGKLVLDQEDSPYIWCEGVNSRFKMPIDEYLSAYSGSIEKMQQGYRS